MGKEYIHAHILFNSVNADTGEKYHSNAQSYYRQIRAISDRLGFRLQGQDSFMYPGRKDALFTEDGICAAIQSGMAAIELGHRPAVIYRPPYRPLKKYPKYTGFDEIRKAIASGFITYITGMAKGTDLVAGEIVLRLREQDDRLKLI